MSEDLIKKNFNHFVNEAQEILDRGGIDVDLLPSEIAAESGLIKPVVTLVGEDGNAFAILGRVRKALIDHYGPDLGREVADEYTEEATSGDYNNLLRVTLNYVDVYPE